MATDTKSRILGAALDLFLEQGMAATRIDQICKRAGVSNGSLFHIFPSKEAIGVALYVGAIASYQAALLAELADDERPPRGTLRSLIAAHWRWIAAEPQRASFLFVQGPPSWHPDAHAQIKTHNAQVHEALTRWLEAPPQRAALRDIPTDAFIPLLLGASMMATRAWLRDPVAPPPEEPIALFTDAALLSLLKDQNR